MGQELVSVIVPTYQEAENLPLLLPRVSEALLRVDPLGEIIVVDDDSKDGTERVCEELAEQYPVRLLIRREDRGLASAVIHGMEQARGQFFVVMDADLSHPPERIPDLLRPLQSGDADFVIGSRYVPGGSTDDEWSVFRWLNSKVATLLARPITSAKDPMAGFFALSRGTFERAPFLNAVGYKIGLELIVKCACKRVVEVPIQFGDRKHGESKLNLQEQVNYLRHLKRLYEYKLGRAAKPVMFGVVGLTGVVVDLTAFTLLLETLPFGGARAVAIWLAMTSNFWLNRRITFSYARRESLVRQYGLFVISCLAGALVNWAVSMEVRSSSGIFAEVPLLSAVCGVGAGALVNYLLAERIAFRLRGAGDEAAE